MIKIEKNSDMVPAMIFFNIPTQNSPDDVYVQKNIPFRQDVTLFFSDERLAIMLNS